MIKTSKQRRIISTQQGLRGPGGLHEKFSETNFLVVSDRGDQYLSDAFGPMKKWEKYCS